MASFDIAGLTVEARRPTIAELTKIRLDPAGLEHESMKGLCKACLPLEDYKKACKAAPAGFRALGMHILEEAGVGGACVLYEEWELEGEQADAYVAQTEKSAELYKDEDDPRRKIYPIAARIQGTDRFMLLRQPHDRQVDEVRKAKSCEAAKAFVESICVHGDARSIERDAPGMYVTIMEFALDLAGDWSVTRLEK